MKSKKNKLITSILTVVLAFSVIMFSGCVEEDVDEPEIKNIVETAKEHDNFNTLVDALLVAGLDEVLSDESAEFTVFAPTDDAFAELDSEFLSDLIENDIDTLTKILTYHVILGTTLSEDLSDEMRVQTVQGKYIDITIDEGTVYINDAVVTTADIECSNGVIHVIDTVLIPKDNIVETAISADDFNTLVEAVIAAELATTLSDESNLYTVFAPTDDAFAELDSDYLTNLINNDTANLSDILLYHVIPGIVLSGDLTDNTTVATVQGTNITITIVNETVFINDSEVTLADIECSNGVIHIIDKVLIPT
ncbi:MAG: fasciclin domain-containing protein [Candidatus Thermoplasmatota archaeon]|nr:fasciclin domain-containing protein [Candidatus Thermoplasmatota archaeon]